MSRTSTILMAASTAACLNASACATAPLRTERSTSAIRAAEVTGAAATPRGALHLQLAKEQLASARILYEQGDTERAHSMLARSESDAELAVALSRGETERSEAQAAVKLAQDFRRENKRNP